MHCGWYLATPGDRLYRIQPPQSSEPLIRRLCRKGDKQELSQQPGALGGKRKQKEGGGRQLIYACTSANVFPAISLGKIRSQRKGAWGVGTCGLRSSARACLPAGLQRSSDPQPPDPTIQIWPVN